MGLQRWIHIGVLVATGCIAMSGGRAAAAPAFTNLSQTDFDAIGKELSANTSLHNVMGASSLGSIFGFEIGVVAGVASTKEIERLVQEASPTTEVPFIPHAGLVGAVTVPFGITAELAIVPEITAEGAKYSSFAGAVKWALSDELIPVIPFNLAVRGFMANSEFKFSQTINNASTGDLPVNVNVAYDGNVTGLQLLASPKLPVFEPYIGVGYLSAKGDLSVTGHASASFFDSTAQSATTKPTSSQFLAGVNVSLLLLKLGAEYSTAFGTSTYTAKLSVGF
ncbi:MAG: hypothetical protein NDI61_04080 [Bdellovibrionaceae bacterium]|nr:hypothetical protein [Pseudobdellovibrionaceae bacterium]